MPQLATDLTLTTAQADTVLSRWLGDGVRCRAIEPLTGGMINTALRLRLDGPPGSVVLKLNAKPDSDGLRQERTRLDHLRAHTRLPVPTAYGYAPADDTLPYSCLLLETIPGVNLTQADLSAADRAIVDRELADALVELHGHTRDAFGRVDEPGVSSWPDLFVPTMLDMRDKAASKLPAAVLDDVDAAIEAAPEVLANQGVPTLIHDDIWAGNIIVQQGDDGWHLSGLVDPSGAKYADVECELAYLQVFDTVGAAFFDRYTTHHRLRPGFEVRRLFYWLETYMIHVWLFPEQAYRDRTAETAAAIRSHLG